MSYGWEHREQNREKEEIENLKGLWRYIYSIMVYL